MVEKREGGRDTQDFEFALSHADIVAMMNDAQVQLQSGHVSSTQTFQIAIRKQNDSEIVLSLREMQPTDKLVFRFKQILDTSTDTEYASIDIVGA